MAEKSTKKKAAESVVKKIQTEVSDAKTEVEAETEVVAEKTKKEGEKVFKDVKSVLNTELAQTILGTAPFQNLLNIAVEDVFKWVETEGLLLQSKGYAYRIIFDRFLKAFGVVLSETHLSALLGCIDKATIRSGNLASMFGEIWER